MPDRKKIIESLEMALNIMNSSRNTPEDEEYLERCAIDALALLKEHDSIVRCKDCKHRPIKPNECISGFDLAFADEVCPCYCQDGYYSWYPPDDWYCANGERR